MRRGNGLPGARGLSSCVVVGASAVAALTIASAIGAPPGPLADLGVRSVELAISDAHGARRVPVPMTASACADGQRCLRGIATDHGLAIAVELGPGVRALPLAVEVHASAATSVRAISVRIVFAARAFEVLGRDYRAAKPARAMLDRFDPKWISLEGRALILDDDVDTVHVERTSGGVLVEVELLSAAARPFGHLPRCGQNWREVRGRVAVPDRHLAVGDLLVAHGELLLGRATPVALSPWPDGRAAAFSITDHADQTSAATLRALLGGASDADLDHPTGGLLAHHVPITKALFQRGALPHGGARPQLEDPTVVALAERARAAGSELVPHSATPRSDDRRAVDETLAWFGERGARVWIDHQPQTNREGFCQSGWHTTSGIADLLAKHGYVDVWDLTEWTGPGLDERDPRHLDRRAPTLWPLGRLEPTGPDSLWMFRSTWAFLPTARFFARYAAAALDELERARGLHVAHTYLETLHPRATFLGRRNVMARQPDGRVVLLPQLDALFAELHRRDERGTLWLTPIGAIGTRLRALRAVRVRITEAGTLAVTRPAGLDGLTLHLAGTVELPADAVRGQRRASGETRAWLSPCPGDAPCTTELAPTTGSLWR